MVGTAVLLFAVLSAQSDQAKVVIAVHTNIIKHDGNGITPSEAIYQVQQAATNRGPIWVTSSARLFSADDPGLVGAENCGADPACLADQLRPLGRFGLLLVVNQDATPPLVALRLVDTETKVLLGTVVQIVDAADPELSTVIKNAAVQLFDSVGYPEYATLHLQVSPPDSTIALVGEPMVSLSGQRLTLPPGPHRVRIDAEGYQSVEKTLSLTAGEKRTLDVALDPNPSITDSPWFWVGAVTAAAGVVTAIVVLAVPRNECLCAAPMTVDCAPGC